MFGIYHLFQQDPAWNRLIPFHEYFHGDTGAGIGASHQTGWTALTINLLLRKSRPHRTAEMDPAVSGPPPLREE